MKVYRILCLLAIGISLVVSRSNAQQHPVLFETFTNICDPCPDPNRKVFDDAVKSLVQSKGGNIIHLEYHVINNCDEIKTTYQYGQYVANRLSGTPNNATSFPLYFGSIDRNFVTATGAHAEPLNSGGSYSDWGAMYTTDANTPAPATIQLVNATMDKKNPAGYVIHADVKITATQNISDSINIYFILAQDDYSISNVSAANPCPPEVGPYENIVRYADLTPTNVFLKGTASGTSKTISWTHTLRSPLKDKNFDYTKIKLVAVLEESSKGTDYHVVNSAILRTDLDTLQEPPPTIDFIDTSRTFKVAEQRFVLLQLTNVDSAAAFYSTDNGSTWKFISNTTGGYFNWTVPDEPTTTGKFKVVGLPDSTPVYIQPDNFTIVRGASISLIHPPANGSEDAMAKKTYTIAWQLKGFDSVNIRYSLDQGTTWKTLKFNAHNGSTTYNWLVPDTIAVARIEVAPTNTSDQVAAQTGDVSISRLVSDGVSASQPVDGLSIENIYPNPTHNTPIVMQYHARIGSHTMLQIFDLLGREVYREDVNSMNTSDVIPTSDLSAGTYVIRLSSEGSVVSKRITVE